MPFDIGFGELLVIGVVALIVIGPKDLPNMFRTVGRATGRMRAMADDFRRTMESAADETGYKDIKSDFDDVSNYTRKESGINEANEAIRDINKTKLATDLTSDNKTEAQQKVSPKAKEKSEELRAKKDAIKAEAKAKSLQNQADQAKKEANKAKAALKPKSTSAKPKKPKAETSKNNPKVKKDKA